MFRFGNPYTRDSSAAALNQRAAATAIAQGGRSGGVANLNSNRDMSHRVVTALALACPCPVPAPPAPPPPPVCGPMMPLWARYAPAATPTWSLTDASDGCVVCGTFPADTSGEFFDTAGELYLAYYANTGGVTGFIVNFYANGDPFWLVYCLSQFGGNARPLKVVFDASSGNTYVCGEWVGGFDPSIPFPVFEMNGGTGSILSTIGDRNNLFIGCIDRDGNALWAAHVTSVSTDSTPIQLSAIDLAVSADGNRIVLYGLAFVSGPPLASRTAHFYNSASGLVGSITATPESSPLFLYSLNAAGLDGNIATIRPEIIRPEASSGSVFGVNLLNVGAHMVATGYGYSNENMLRVTDSGGAVSFINIQASLTIATGFVVQFNPLAGLEWTTCVIGTLNPTDTPVSTSSGFAGHYQRGIVGLAGGGGYVYTGNYSDVVGGISFVDSNGLTPQMLARSPDGAIYMAPLSLAGFHTAPWHADTSGGVGLLVLNGYVDGSGAGAVFFLCSAALQTSIDGVVYFYNAGAITPAVTVPMAWSEGSTQHLLVKYSAAGVCQWIRRIGGINDLRYGNVVVSSLGCPIVYGPFSGAVARFYDGAGGVAGSLANSGGGRDGFYAKWTADGDFVGVAGLLTTANDANVWMTVAGGGEAYTLTNNYGNLGLQSMVGGTVFTIPSGTGSAMTLARWKAI